ncbi:hypothetical protein TIFTF001_014748 [Ficus carica]|uniref:SWI/SNF complex subunit SWI3C n=1 Tax=Ficus carica TaxID=3494 RepID=A0AA88D5W5_FICCA|nr:hypothetical protein TIFTF001_014748 [Ficus carica]
MPASPSFPSDGRGKWRKRKKEPQINRRQKQEEEDDDEEDADDADLDHQRDEDYSEGGGAHPNNHQQSADPAPPPQETEVLSDGGVRVCDFPPVVRHAVNRPHPSLLAIAALERANQSGESKAQGQGSTPQVFLENVSYGQLQSLSAVPADSPGLDPDRSDGATSSYVVTPPPIMEGRGVVKRFGNRCHVVPMHSDWFSPGTVHRLERQAVPHFFSGKSPDHTPEKYMDCRNYVVAKYMENPEKQITVSDLQGLIGGVDSEDLNRIVRFLDHWGIINYCATAAPSRESWNDCSYLREDKKGDIHVPVAALKSIDSLIKFDKPNCKLKAADVYLDSGHDDNVSDLDNRIRERLSENHCNYCSRPLPTIFYQSHKEVDIMLCSDCYHEGRYVTGHSSLDFTKTNSTKDYADPDGESWTDQETYLLLEGVEIYNENWNEIAEHVGTKSKAQCILHFLRLPVEDGLLENIDVPGMSVSSNQSNGDVHGRSHAKSKGGSTGSSQQEADSDNIFPFANSGNPVMSLVAFLASAVGPRVAAACAHASLAALSEDNGSEGPLQKDGLGHSNRMNSESIQGRDGGSQGEMANSVHQKGNSAMPGSRSQNEAGAAPLSAEKVKAAAVAGLAGAATKAKLFADHEEREIQRLSANIINHQLKRLELKLKQFAEVETFLMKECEQVERQRQRLFAERARYMATRMGPAGVSSPMNPPAAGPSMANNNTGNNNRQQVMSAAPSQPSISGYNNTNQPQQVHPHMPFMPRQPMFGLGPRLPLSALQPSSSAPSNAMFNASGNAQPSMNHPMLRPVHGTSSGLG